MKTVDKVAAFVVRPGSEGQARVLLFRYEAFPEWPPEIPGGGIEPGETPEEAVLRELREESPITQTENSRVCRCAACLYTSI